MACWKRTYESERAAHGAMARAGFRYRVYRCPDCFRYHVTANEKRENRLGIERHHFARRNSAR
jgi:hypothetical protein